MTKAAKRRGTVFIISAPSGCGKTTLLKRLVRDKALRLVHSVSATSRAPRADEREGVDYHFISRKAFLRDIARGAFLEWEENFGNLYGTPKKFIRDALARRRNVLLNIDVKGAMRVRRAFPGRCVLIFIMPPSMKELRARLRKRKTDASYVISTRLKIARREMAYRRKYDHLVVNDDLDEAHTTLRAIIASGGARQDR